MPIVSLLKNNTIQKTKFFVKKRKKLFFNLVENHWLIKQYQHKEYILNMIKCYLLFHNL